MKFAAFALFTALPLAAAAQATKEDVKKLAAAGVSEDVILTYVRAHGGAPRMSADDIVELKKAGVGDRVLSVLAGSTTTPAPAAERVVEKPVYVQQPTYVYASTPYYGYDNYYSPSYYYRPYGYYSSWYPRSSYYYSGWCGPSYRSSFYYSSCRPRVGLSIGWGWRW